MTDALIETFSIGYLPDQSDLLLTFFQNKDIPYQVLLIRDCLLKHKRVSYTIVFLGG